MSPDTRESAKDVPPTQKALNTFVRQCTPPDKTKKNERTTYLAVAHALSGGQAVSAFGQQKVMQAKQILRRGGFGRMRKEFAVALCDVCAPLLETVSFESQDGGHEAEAATRRHIARTLAAAIRTNQKSELRTKPQVPSPNPESHSSS